jgi:hypothetical protein
MDCTAVEKCGSGVPTRLNARVTEGSYRDIGSGSQWRPLPVIRVAASLPPVCLAEDISALVLKCDCHVLLTPNNGGTGKDQRQIGVTSGIMARMFTAP